MSATSAPTQIEPRRTTADTVFNALRDDITNMRLCPGTRLSEAEVAKQYDISRQPVREAFIRLDNLGLLHIRPQRATVVRPMSRERIRRARFVRLSVELEVARRAFERHGGPTFNTVLDTIQHQTELQRDSLKRGDMAEFNALDYTFHSELCLAADCPHAMEVIRDCKATTDRLCILSIVYAKRAPEVLEDHQEIVERLSARDLDGLLAVTREHLGRLDESLSAFQREHPDYFED
jgi:DNA-binding GntR family transcriptional regulator